MNKLLDRQVERERANEKEKVATSSASGIVDATDVVIVFALLFVMRLIKLESQKERQIDRERASRDRETKRQRDKETKRMSSYRDAF